MTKPELNKFNLPVAKPVDFKGCQVVIQCPFCNKKHYHGLCTDLNYWGSRVCHCLDMSGREYFIIRDQLLEQKQGLEVR